MVNKNDGYLVVSSQHIRMAYKLGECDIRIPMYKMFDAHAIMQEFRALIFKGLWFPYVPSEL